MRMRRGAGRSCSDCCALMIRLSSTWCSWSASASDQRDVVGEVERDLDAAGAHRVAGDVERRGDDVVDRDRAALAAAAGAPSRGTCARCARSARRRRGSSPPRDLGRRVALLLEQHGARDDHRQRVVELVRDAGQQRAERGQLLALVRATRAARASSLGERFFSVMSRAIVSTCGSSAVLHRDAVELDASAASRPCGSAVQLDVQRLAGRHASRRKSGGYDGPRQRRGAKSTASGRRAIAVHPPQRRVGVDDLAGSRPTARDRRSTR